MIKDRLKLTGGPNHYTSTCPSCAQKLVFEVAEQDGRETNDRIVFCDGGCGSSKILRAAGLPADALISHLPPPWEDALPPPVGYVAKPTTRAGDTLAEEEWKPPIPFDEVKVPDFPMSCLPPVVREYAQAVADAVQVSPDMVAAAILPIVALCVQKKFCIEGKPDWLEPLNLYGMIVALPAERKSAIAEKMTRPIQLYEAEYNKLIQMEIDYYETQKNLLIKDIKRLEEQAIKGKATVEEVADKRNQLSTLEEVTPLRLWTDNATMEAIISLMAQNDGRTAIVSAEGGVFDIMAGRYTNGTDVEVYLKAHAGDAIRVDRKGRPSEYINRPAMSMLLFVQPVVLDGVMGNETFRGRGLVARFLYSIPNSRVGTRKFETERIPQGIETEFNAMLHDLLRIQVPEEEHVIKLSPEAHKSSSDFFYWLEPQLKRDLEGIGDWAGKLHGAILRIAGVYHSILHGEEAPRTLVEAATMVNAITTGMYFLEHAKAAYRLMGADAQTQGARYILRMLEKDKPKSITRTELTRLCRGQLTADSMEAPVSLLVEYGYFREQRDIRAGVGRRLVTYAVNPHTYGNYGSYGKIAG